MKPRNLFTAAILLLTALSSCNVVHKHKSLNISRRDSTGTLAVADTHSLRTDSSDRDSSDSTYFSGTITAGDSGISIELAPVILDTVKAAFREYSEDTAISGNKTFSRPGIRLSKGSTITFQKGEIKAVHEAQKQTVDTSTHNQQQTSAVQDKQKVKTDNSVSSRIPWVGIVMVALLLALIFWTWHTKVTHPFRLIKHEIEDDHESTTK
jgi:cobalamin biosynthesis Mg chelatase CobN